MHGGYGSRDRRRGGILCTNRGRIKGLLSGSDGRDTPIQGCVAKATADTSERDNTADREKKHVGSLGDKGVRARFVALVFAAVVDMREAYNTTLEL